MKAIERAEAIGARVQPRAQDYNLLCPRAYGLLQAIIDEAGADIVQPDERQHFGVLHRDARILIHGSIDWMAEDQRQLGGTKERTRQPIGIAREWVGIVRANRARRRGGDRSTRGLIWTERAQRKKGRRRPNQRQ